MLASFEQALTCVHSVMPNFHLVVTVVAHSRKPFSTIGYSVDQFFLWTVFKSVILSVDRLHHIDSFTTEWNKTSSNNISTVEYGKFEEGTRNPK